MQSLYVTGEGTLCNQLVPLCMSKTTSQQLFSRMLTAHGPWFQDVVAKVLL